MSDKKREPSKKPQPSPSERKDHDRRVPYVPERPSDVTDTVKPPKKN